MDCGRASALDSAGVETVREFSRTPRVGAGVSPYVGGASLSIYSSAARGLCRAARGPRRVARGTRRAAHGVRDCAVA
eukprot:5400798-Pyramimonas_sp.AAC.1